MVQQKPETGNRLVEDSDRPEGILDATCGGRSIWLPEQKDHDNALYIDRREREPGFLEQDGRTYSIEPDEIQDFRDLPYSDEEFNLIVFDPPHKVHSDGMKDLDGIMDKAYGALHAETWQSDLRDGFEELFRVLSPGGTLIFKFADGARDFDEVISLAPIEPLFGTTTTQRETSETRFYVFHKDEP
jgi:SAM-dependent methyltransferase